MKNVQIVVNYKLLKKYIVSTRFLCFFVFVCLFVVAFFFFNFGHGYSTSLEKIRRFHWNIPHSTKETKAASTMQNFWLTIKTLIKFNERGKKKHFYSMEKVVWFLPSTTPFSTFFSVKMKNVQIVVNYKLLKKYIVSTRFLCFFVFVCLFVVAFFFFNFGHGYSTSLEKIRRFHWNIPHSTKETKAASTMQNFWLTIKTLIKFNERGKKSTFIQWRK